MISKRNILNFETRRKIYEFVENNPGLHFNEISRRIEIPRTTLFHHLRVLEKQDLIELRYKGEYKYVYPKNELGAKEKEILELLRKKIPCIILLHFFFSHSCSQIELSRDLNLHPSTVSYHLKKMMKMGIIEVATAENVLFIHLLIPMIVGSSVKNRKEGKFFIVKKTTKLFMEWEGF